MLFLNREVFFNEVRNGPFPGRLTPEQVSGMDDLLDTWEQHGTDDTRHLAYTFATNFHETGQKMQPVREGFKATDREAEAYVQRLYGRKGKDWYCWADGPFGHVYFGRGDVQLTWYDNYVRMGKILKLPLAEKPHLMLESKISKRVLVEGMLNGVSGDGDFTGLALEDFFNAAKDDALNARKIVNRMDKAAMIARYHYQFLAAINKAKTTPPRRAPAVRLPAAGAWGSLAAAISKFLLSITRSFK